MGLILVWAANKGLNLGESLFRELIGLKSFETILSEKLDLINQKLDILIGAPFRQARMHLLEGNIEKCKEKLIEAISLNEFDLPSMVLYSFLLYKSGNSSLALDYFEGIIRKFGPHPEITPKEITEVYCQYLVEEKPLRMIQGFDICAENNMNDTDKVIYPTDIYCTQSSIITIWKTMLDRGYGFGAQIRATPRVIIYDWSGREIMNFEDFDPSILAFTEEYVAIMLASVRLWRKVIKVFRVKDGSEVMLPFSVTLEQLQRLFYIDHRLRAEKHVTWAPNAKLYFGGAEISITDYKFEKLTEFDGAFFSKHREVLTYHAGKISVKPFNDVASLPAT
jgi:hypothetical protein